MIKISSQNYQLIFGGISQSESSGFFLLSSSAILEISKNFQSLYNMNFEIEKKTPGLNGVIFLNVTSTKILSLYTKVESQQR